VISTTGRAGLKAALYARRKQMGRAARGRQRKPTRWLYPWATERRYATAIKAWMRPMIEYVHQYLKNNQEAILRGDSAALVRQDATPGGSYRRMVKSLNGWYTTYIPPLTDFENRSSPPIIYMGLGSIAESMNDFNSAQWEKAAKAELGVEFPVYEDWWQGTKSAWQDENYRLIHKMAEDYISRINMAAERAVTSGMSPAQLSQAIHKIDSTIKTSRANLIARDQIGKLNGRVTQARMEAVGLNLYEWSTSLDERVRESHLALEGKICRWDDPSLYTDDGGKTWKDRPASWCQFHPGEDIQCRCTALAYWDELVNEVDQEIDLLAQEGDNIHSGVEGLRVMGKPPVKSKDELLKQQRKAAEQQRRQENARKAKKFADQEFPGEKWKQVEDGIYISPRRNLEELVKNNELRDAQVLRDLGSTVYLVPHVSRSDGTQYDAIVNGLQMELKNVGGAPGTLESAFLKSREQAPNVFINLETSTITRNEAITALYKARNSVKRIDKNGKERRGYAEYNRFKGGRIILKLQGHKNLIYFNVDDLKASI
jgi:SPP1 gp7 family putative phage head morphogenesis protein